jgi:O-antigen ligase
MPFSIPHFQANNLILFLLAANSILLFAFQSPRTPLPDKRVFFLFISLYLILFFGLLHTDNFEQGRTDLEKKVALMLLPAIVFLSPKLKSRQYISTLLTFVAGCVFTCLFCLGRGLYIYLVSAENDFPLYHEFSQLANLSANYLALYVCFAIGITVILLRNIRHSITVFFKVILVGCLIIFTVSILILSSRTHILIMTVGLVIFSGYWLLQYFSVAKAIGGATIIGATIIVVTFMVPRNRERFLETITYNEERWGEQHIRGSIWTCAFELMESNFFTGVGTGDTRDELESCYKSHDFYALLHFDGVRFNAHSQYFEILIEQGIIGLLFFLTVLITCAIRAVRANNLIFLIFLCVFAISCVTESLLERQKGILLFSFFAPFLFFAPEMKRPDEVT